MPAKSIRSRSPFQHRSRHARFARSALSTLVLAASVTALGLIVHSQHPGWLKLSPTQQEDFAADDSVLDEINRKSAAHREHERDQAISAFLAKRYRVSPDLTLDFVRMAFAAGHRIGIDPLLIIAVMAVESRLNPIAESVAGAKGLMQIIPKYHAEKFEAFGGEKAVFEPGANIVVGSQILREYIQRTGDVSLGLRIYGGGPVEGENHYPAKVLGEKRRLQQVVSQYHQSTPRPTSSNQVTL
jgi:soluble lytic murein transglycosylase-like protein